MAFSQTLNSSQSLSLLQKSTSPYPTTSRSTVSVRLSASFPRFKKDLLSVGATSVAAPPLGGGVAPAIALTDNALKHLNKMRSERNEDLCLRIGVKQGGCSGLSYTMEFESKDNNRPGDSVIEYDGFAIGPKSLLFLFGMQLDYSAALIGGGFNFSNPNATQTCGCGKSFAAEI